MRELEKILKALANRRRLEIVKHLKEKKYATVGDLSEHIRLSFKATSKHLAVLLGADIVAKEQRGLYAVYTLASKSKPEVRHILALL